MPIFKYKALDKNSTTKDGLVESMSKEFAIETLQENGLQIISINKVSDTHKMGLSFFDKVKAKDLVIFSRQFAVMISANVAMVQALKIIVEQTENLKLKMIISEIADEVDGGSKLSYALSKRPNVFSNFFVSVIKSGESSGKLDEVLNYLADEMEKDYDITSKVKGAMIYPAFVLSGLIIVGIVMMIFVVPKLTGILTETGAELPMSTKLVIGVSDFLSSFWWVLVLAVIGVIVGYKYYVKTPQGKRNVDFLLLRLPIFGKLFQLIYLVRFARTLNTLIVGGVTILNSLKITSEVVNNRIYQELIDETIKEVEDGNSISTIFVTSSVMPKMVSQMLNIGEKTGKIDVILERITDFYGREINNMVANLMTLMEPIIMVVMGVAVGIMVAAIILPMYNLAGQF